MKSLIFVSSLLLINCSARQAKDEPQKANPKTQYEVMKVDTPLIDVNEDYLLGMFDPTTHPDFVSVAKEHKIGRAHV